MEKITLITGNKNKLKEFKYILEDEGRILNLDYRNLDLREIQSMDLKEICQDKAREAFKIIKKPVIVEDTGFFLEDLNGLPGPFIKFFQEKLGTGALIKLLGNSKNRKGSSKTCITYYDGKNMVFGFGELKGKITLKLSENNGVGFGFDYCFIPDSYDKTCSELGEDVKNKISHRRLAIDDFKKNYFEKI